MWVGGLGYLNPPPPEPKLRGDAPASNIKYDSHHRGGTKNGIGVEWILFLSS